VTSTFIHRWCIEGNNGKRRHYCLFASRHFDGALFGPVTTLGRKMICMFPFSAKTLNE
jgi:hypothetical protein